jgi:hypothetical protein
MYRTSKHTHRQLGVGGLLGGELLIEQTTVICISAGKTGLVTLSFGGLAHATSWRRCRHYMPLQKVFFKISDF